MSLPAQPLPEPIEFDYLGLTEGQLVGYRDGWARQREIHAQVADRTLPPQVLFVEHDHVFTAGHRTEPHERPVDGTEVVEVDRGGKITYHGPGQLVGYPIVPLPERVGVVDYVRRVEEALIRLLAEYGLTTGRIEGRTGVWLAASGNRPERKIAAIGVRVSRRTTLHGFALNVDPDLSWFGRIVPCGIDDAGVTSLAAELGSAPRLSEVAKAAEPHLAALLDFSAYLPSAPLAIEPRPAVQYGLTGITA